MTKREVSTSRFLFALASLSLQVYSIYLLFFGSVAEGISIATITFGDTSAPSDIAKYFDAVFTQSLQNSRGMLIDNIGASNAFLHSLIKSDNYEATDGGTHIEEQLMHALSPMESYDGYDELSTAPTDGISAALYEWRQLATPVTYSMKEVIQNRRKIINLVKTKMTQCQMGIEEGFSRDFMQGSGAGALATPRVNGVNGSLSIEPLPKLVRYDPTFASTVLVGNINPSTSSWWRNRVLEDGTAPSVASTTPATFLKNWMNIYNTCSLGTGGSPDICLVDQGTYELCSMVLYERYRNTTTSDNTFPFTNIRIPFGSGKSLLVLDDKVPDVFSGTLATTTFGTMYLLNSKFFKIRPIEGRDFEMLTDEQGKTFAKPINQDARVGHCAWMGQTTVNNRRKHGVWGKIPRTLTF